MPSILFQRQQIQKYEKKNIFTENIFCFLQHQLSYSVTYFAPFYNPRKSIHIWNYIFYLQIILMYLSTPDIKTVHLLIIYKLQHAKFKLFHIFYVLYQYSCNFFKISCNASESWWKYSFIMRSQIFKNTKKKKTVHII